MRIIITESQYRRVFKEQYEELNLIAPPQAMTDTISTAINYDLDLKKSATDEKFKVTWEELGYDPNKLPNSIKKKYPEYVPEIISGYGEKNKFNTALLDVLKLIEEKSGLDVIITGGNDYYHQIKRPNSKHNTGNAIDFEVSGYVGKGATDELQMKIEEVILSIAMNEYPNLSFINEYKKDTGGSGGHFHLSLMKELNYYYFYDEALRKEGEKYYGCCGKYKDKNNRAVLTFTGNGSSLKGIMDAGREKEPMKLEKMPIRQPEPIKTKPIKDLPEFDIDKEVTRVVNEYKGKKKKDIKNAIKGYEEFKITMAKTESDLEYVEKIINGLNNLLNEV